MDGIVTIEWRFSPKDYFEEPVEFFLSEANIKIADGLIQAILKTELYGSNPSLCQLLEEHLNDRFLGVQLVTHKPYTLTRAHTTRVWPDGRRDITVEVNETICIGIDFHSDVQVVDTDGNIIVDSRRDRIERKIGLAGLVGKYRSTDQLLASLIRSHDAAVRDLANELVHLYEIREAVCTKFGGEGAARKALAIGSAAWSRFGRICNDEPLRQGRHRGKTSGALRDASEGELREARNFARTLVEAYLQYLESRSAT